MRNLVASGDQCAPEAEAGYAHKKQAELPIEFKESVTVAAVLASHDVAIRRNLSFYDALYLALATKEDASLATLDEPLKRAAAAEGVDVL